LHEVDKEPNWLFEHRLPQLIAKRRKTAAIDAVVLLEAAEIEPVAAELHGQTSNAIVRQHSPGLCGENLRLMQVAGRGAHQKFGIRHARPEEVTQSAGQFVIAERP